METKKFKFKTKKNQEGKQDGPSKKTIIAGTTAGGVASVAIGAGIAAATQEDEVEGPANLHTQEEQVAAAGTQQTAQAQVHHTAATEQPVEPQPEEQPEEPHFEPLEKEESLMEGLTPDDENGTLTKEESLMEGLTPDDENGTLAKEESLQEGLIPDDENGTLAKEESLQEGLTPDDENGLLAKEESLQEGLTPDDEASQILKDSLVDPDDIDEQALINVDNLSTMDTADGRQVVVANFHTPDGDKYMLADLDGDGVFSDVLDLEGNHVATAEGGATLADLVEMSDDSAGYLPPMEDYVAMGDDPADDIIDTDEMLMAMLDDLDDKDTDKEVIVGDDDLDALDDLDDDGDDDDDDDDLADDISDDEDDDVADDTLLT